jgi:hypothetical protein
VNPTQPPLWYSAGRREAPFVKVWANKGLNDKLRKAIAINVSKLRIAVGF